MALNNVIRNSDDPSPRRTLTLAMLFAEAIATISKTNSLGGVPAGHLYAMSAMPAGISLAEFDAAIAVLVHTRYVSRKSDLLIWIGPTQ